MAKSAESRRRGIWSRNDACVSTRARSCVIVPIKTSHSSAGSAEQWLDKHGEYVRLFRNRVDHYDEDMVSGGSLEEQSEKSAGVSISHRGQQIELRIRGKGREFNLEVTDILRELDSVYQELEALDHHRWGSEL
mgnify:CR=1 FL=1